MIAKHVRENFNTPPGWEVKPRNTETVYIYHNEYTPAVMSPRSFYMPKMALYHADSHTFRFTVETNQNDHYLPYTYLDDLQDIPQSVSTRNEFERFAYRIADTLQDEIFQYTFKQILHKLDLAENTDTDYRSEYDTYFEFCTAIAHNPNEFPEISAGDLAALLTHQTNNTPEHTPNSALMHCPSCSTEWWQLHNTNSLNELLNTTHIHCPVCDNITFTRQCIGQNIPVLDFKSRTAISTPQTIASYTPQNQ